jgi:hypothetical protein
MSKAGYIYLIHAVGTNRYKIGLTVRTVEERLAELNSSQAAYPLKLVDSLAVLDVHATEKYYHQKYKSDRVYGEWFEFDSKKIQSVAAEFKNRKKHTIPLVTFRTFLLALGLALLLIQCHYSQTEHNRAYEHKTKIR